MINKNVILKNQTDLGWESLYPITKTGNIKNEDGTNLIDIIDNKENILQNRYVVDKMSDVLGELHYDGNLIGSGDMCKSTYDTNNSGIVDNAKRVNGMTVLSSVPRNAVFTDTTYKIATSTDNGLMSSTDKEKLDNISQAEEFNVFVKKNTIAQLEGVGIGTSTPNESLDIVGNARIRESGSIKFGGVGAEDAKFEIKYNNLTESLDFNFLG